MATTYVWIVCSLADTTGQSGWFDLWTTAEKCQLIPRLANHWDCVSLKRMGGNFMAQSLMTIIVWSSNRSSVSCLAWSCWKVFNKWAFQASMLETELSKSHLALSFCFSLKSRSPFLRVSSIAFALTHYKPLADGNRYAPLEASHHDHDTLHGKGTWFSTQSLYEPLDWDSLTWRKFQCFCSKGYVLEECGSGKDVDEIPNFLHIEPASENFTPCLWFSASMFWRVLSSILYLA